MLGSVDELIHNFTHHATTEDEIIQVFDDILTNDKICAKSPGKMVTEQITFSDNDKKDWPSGSSNNKSGNQLFMHLVGLNDTGEQN